MFGKLNDIIDKGFLLIFSLCILFGLYIVSDSWYMRTAASGSQFYAFRPEKDTTDAYMELGDECIGWIYVEDTDIDYPLMQAEDNIKYLNTAPDGSYSLAGSIFLDWQCSKHFDDRYSLIYGHHMSDGYMFGALDSFSDNEYFNKHKKAEITFDGEIHHADIIAFAIVDAHNKVLFQAGDYDNQLDVMKKEAKHMDLNAWKDGQQLIALSTCKDPGTTERTVLFLTIGDEKR